jgi:beta-lactamase class D/D-alanyl-D-alanine dipeptidase
MKRAVLIFSLLFFIAHALSSAAPAQIKNNSDKEADLIELIKLDKTIKLDIRYATANNFTGRVVYPEARAFLQRPAAEALLRVHKKLKEQGLGLVIYDGYRPWTITKYFWDTVQLDQRKFVADPAKGSKHNRGCAVDLAIYNLKTGEYLDMPSGYDEFTERASPDYKGATELQKNNREFLRGLMESEGFNVNPNEWWHFDYKDWQEYGIYDIAFTDIRNYKELENLSVRRVEFAGNASVRDRKLRKFVHLHEGDMFTAENLKKSVAGINHSGLFDPISDQHVSYAVDKKYNVIDLVFYLRQKDEPKTIAYAEIKEDPKLKKSFDTAGVTGGIYIYDLKKNKYTIYDRRRMDTGFVPASSSKIFHSLIFLESDAVKDENEVIKWDGVKRWVEAWNQDQTLKSALKVSAAWAFVEMSKRAGRETMQKYYDEAGYGNRSTEGFGEAYWVNGKLRVTPRQQIEFLVKLHQNKLPFSPHALATVKDIIVSEKNDSYTMRGKTGWSTDFDPQVGWWIGYVENKNGVYFFATELDIKKDADAEKRKLITNEVLKSLKII